MKQLLAIAALLASVSTAGLASAQSYTFTATSQNGSTGTGTLTTAATPNATGGYDITGITGTFGGLAITGLISNPATPDHSSSADFTWDNILFPTSSIVFDRYGLAFTAVDVQYNFYNAVADGTTPPEGFPYGVLTSPSSGQQFGTFSITAAAGAVPEPATWAMMLLGFGMVGFGMRYRRKSQTAKVSFA